MTRDERLHEIMALADRPLGVAVGREVMGYTVYHYDKGYNEYWMLMDREFERVAPFRAGEGCHAGERDTELLAWCDAPPFESDRNACADMEAEIKRRGLALRYGMQLARAVSPAFYLAVAAAPDAAVAAAPDAADAAEPTLTFLLATADPETRCRAALLAVLEGDGPEARRADL